MAATVKGIIIEDYPLDEGVYLGTAYKNKDFLVEVEASEANRLNDGKVLLRVKGEKVALMQSQGLFSDGKVHEFTLYMDAVQKARKDGTLYIINKTPIVMEWR